MNDESFPDEATLSLINEEFKKTDQEFEDLEMNCHPYDYFKAGWLLATQRKKND